MKQLITAVAAVLFFGTAWAQTRTIEAAASITPKAPATGQNRLEVVFLEGGKPVTGLKLTSSVGMTNMDMGTAHPPVKESSPGHYVIRPMLLMGGPWRVTLLSADPKFSIKFDMTADGKQVWQPAKQTITIAGGAAPPNQEPPKTEPPKTEPAKQEPPMQGGTSYGGHMAASLPELHEKASYVWSDSMDFDTRTGFGKLEPMVRMMILMMVGGSGMEGMKMAPTEMKFDETNFLESGDEPMNDMPGMTAGDKPLKVRAVLGKPTVGDNNITVTITTPDGKPVEKAKITTSVAMTSMDMGTTHPAVKELGKGNYAVRASFSMAGPWRLTLTVSAPKVKAATYTFDFEAK